MVKIVQIYGHLKPAGIIIRYATVALLAFTGGYYLSENMGVKISQLQTMYKIENDSLVPYIVDPRCTRKFETLKNESGLEKTIIQPEAGKNGRK